MKKQTKPGPGVNQRGISVLELLFAATTLAAAVLIGAMSEPKIPKGMGE